MVKVPVPRVAEQLVARSVAVKRRNALLVQLSVKFSDSSQAVRGIFQQ